MAASKTPTSQGRKPTPSLLSTPMDDLIGAAALRDAVPEETASPAIDPAEPTPLPPLTEPSPQPTSALLRPPTDHRLVSTSRRAERFEASSPIQSPIDPTEERVPQLHKLRQLKQTHYLDAATLDRLEDVIHTLKRHARRLGGKTQYSQSNARVNSSRFIEAALMIALDDFERIGTDSAVAQFLLNGSYSDSPDSDRH